MEAPMRPRLFESDHCRVTAEGRLLFDGVDLTDLVARRQGAMFLISERILSENYARLVQGFASVPSFAAYYSVKTNFETEVLRTLRRLGAGAEISGDLDLHVALKAGFSPSRIVFDGPCKTTEELERAVEQRIRCINVESVEEIHTLESIAAARGITVDVGVRIDPMTRRPYYDKLITTYKQKFGFHIHHADEAFQAVRASRHLRLVGINAHIGSQILAPGLYVEALDAMFGLAAALRGRGFPLEEINVGGGFPAQSMRHLRLTRRMRGAKLLERFGWLEKRTPPIDEFGRTIADCYAANARRHGFSPTLSIEPGRSLVNNACVLLGRVRRSKPNWLFTDLSINEVAENLFFTEWRVFFPSRMHEPPVGKANISGPTLSTYDVLFFQKDVPALVPGDPVAIFDTGGYSITRANQFTKPRNPVYFVTRDGDIRLIRRRETVEDVVQPQVWDDLEAAEAPPLAGIDGRRA
jgi:diaminopimelate decarboxylase